MSRPLQHYMLSFHGKRVTVEGEKFAWDEGQILPSRQGGHTCGDTTTEALCGIRLCQDGSVERRRLNNKENERISPKPCWRISNFRWCI